MQALEEEVYVSAIEKIIRRDFFPGEPQQPRQPTRPRPFVSFIYLFIVFVLFIYLHDYIRVEHAGGLGDRNPLTDSQPVQLRAFGDVRCWIGIAAEPDREAGVTLPLRDQRLQREVRAHHQVPPLQRPSDELERGVGGRTGVVGVVGSAAEALALALTEAVVSIGRAAIKVDDDTVCPACSGEQPLPVQHKS